MNNEYDFITQSKILDLTAFFIYFHHLTEDIRSQFQWVTFGRLKSVSVLKIDQNCIDNQFIDTVTDVWAHSLTDFHIEVHDSYSRVRNRLNKLKLFMLN